MIFFSTTTLNLQILYNFHNLLKSFRKCIFSHFISFYLILNSILIFKNNSFVYFKLTKVFYNQLYLSSGPNFQLQSLLGDKSCLEGMNHLQNPATVSLQACDYKNYYQTWSRVTDNRLLNVHNGQCLAYNSSTNQLMTVNCDREDINLKWDAEDVSLYHENNYLDSINGKIVSDPAQSQWHALVDIGSGSLRAMECEFCDLFVKFFTN